MQNDKWQDPNAKVLNFKYIVLSFSATILIVVGVIGNFLPDIFSVLGNDIKNSIHQYWFIFVGLGILIGAINAYTTFSANKKA